MMSVQGKRSAGRWGLLVAGGILVGVLAGLLLGWQLAPGMVVIYFAVNWAADAGQKQRRELDAYREQWLNKRKPPADGLGQPKE